MRCQKSPACSRSNKHTGRCNKEKAIRKIALSSMYGKGGPVAAQSIEQQFVELACNIGLDRCERAISAMRTAEYLAQAAARDQAKRMFT